MTRECPIKPNPPLNKKIKVGKKNLKGHPKHSDLHGNIIFKNKFKELEKVPPVVHFQPNLHFF